MKLYLRVHYGWLPKKSTEGVPELDKAIENALTPFGIIDNGMGKSLPENLGSGGDAWFMRDDDDDFNESPDGLYSMSGY